MRRILAALTTAATAAGLALAAPAHALPYCDVPVPPPACNDDPVEDPPPPIGTDTPPTGRVESHGYTAGTYRVTGWARDTNGGPVTVWVTVDQTFIGAYPANLHHPAQGGPHGFDITVPAPTTAGNHRVNVTLVNVPDGTQPAAPYSGILAILGWTNTPAAPTDLVLTPTHGDITVAFTDPSTTEDGFSVTYDWIERKFDSYGHWTNVTESRTIHAPAAPGTGRYTLPVTGLRSNTFHRFYIRTKEAGLLSTTLTAGVATLA
ncbi:hypothetical protein [Micromonospora okii]|uniref:hypothetical protein n=1 Tax=Micromonospora okii TaxID=1182970 RepID=UPI0021044233|nr:hypothetical protein [Micromonospora okii]